MNIVDKPEQNPGICFLCEAANECRFVDTFRHFDAGGPTHLSGRKYVCENCIFELAEVMGAARPSVVEELEAQVAKLKDERDAAVEDLEARKAFSEAVAKVGAFAPQPVKPPVEEPKERKKPGPKPKADKADG